MYRWGGGDRRRARPGSRPPKRPRAVTACDHLLFEFYSRCNDHLSIQKFLSRKSGVSTTGIFTFPNELCVSCPLLESAIKDSLLISFIGGTI